MEKFNLNELLRYVGIGAFFIFLCYLTFDKQVLKDQIDMLGKDNIAAIIISLSLMSGITIYVLYRAFFFALIFNPLLTWLSNEYRMNNLPGYANLSIMEVIRKTDIDRWKIKDEEKSKRLHEWASQVHYTYNMAICCITVFILSKSCNDYPVLLILGFLLLVIAMIHQYRYKIFEIQVTKI